MISARAFRSWIQDFIDQQDTLEKRLFWLVFSVVECMVILSALMIFWEDKANIGAIVLRWTCVYAFLEIMVIGKRSGRYRECYMAMCLLFNCLLLPLNFFYCGGIVGSIPLHFSVGLFMCSFCMSNVQKITTFIISLLSMIITMVIGCLYPEFVYEMSIISATAHTIIGLILTGCAIYIVCSLVMREYKNQRHKEINNGIIDVLSTVVESRSVESGDHVMRIKGYTRILLEHVNDIYGINIPKDEKEVIYSASAMHDVGKIAIPDSILLKPGRFTPEEFEVMKSHTILGCDIISAMENIQDRRYYDYSYAICRYHHERYDGKGYPDGLKGEEIPLAAQIVSLADVYDALVNKRCYKKAFSFEKAFNMIINGECGTFSPKILECFRRSRAKMEEFANEPFVNPIEIQREKRKAKDSKENKEK